ncbi:Very-short-patch-repair endonuclease [Rhizobium sp. RU20A]|nr:Very-short-patch-repair endonuclease [Rhizobium sp. RU20A]
MAETSSAWIRRDGATGRARSLRRDETEAEYRLRFDLKNRNLNGFKFSRQIPLGPFFADFVCRQEKLVVEIDGSQHADSLSDARRTDWLNAQGYNVLRFWNHEILEHRRDVLETIVAALEGRLCKRSEATRFYPAASGCGEGTR